MKYAVLQRSSQSSSLQTNGWPAGILASTPALGLKQDQGLLIRSRQHRQRSAQQQHVVRAAASKPPASQAQGPPTTPSFDLSEGWGVEVPSTPATTSPETGGARGARDWEEDFRAFSAPASSAPGKKAKAGRVKAGKKGQQAEAAAGAPGSCPAKARVASDRAPYVSMNSEAGVLSLELLKQKLLREEGGGGLDLAGMKQQLAEAATTAQEVTQQRNTGGQVGLGKVQAEGLCSAAEAAGLACKARKKQRRVVYVDDDENIIGEEDEDADITDGPAFSLTIGEEGTEFAEYDKQGALLRQARRPIHFVGDDDDEDEEADYEDDEDDLDFSGSAAGSWGTLARSSNSSIRGRTAASRGIDDEEDERSRRLGELSRGGGPEDVLSARQVEALLGGEGAAGSGLLLGGEAQKDEEQDWGLEEISDRRSQSLMEQLGVVKPRRQIKMQPGSSDADGTNPQGGGTIGDDVVVVQWGGSGGLGSSVDMDEQEAILRRLFKPHKVKELLAHQRAAINASLDLKKRGSSGGRGGKYGAEAKLHRQLRIIGGSAMNRKLLSSQGSQTRPMMEKVRAAIFSMIQSQAGTASSLPQGSRWLDLFAGTGSVGLEAMSRGSEQVHFVEMDPWVVRNVLGPNITTCGFNRQAVVHTAKAEAFLQKARSIPRFAGGAFDFISVCPPYLLVSYPELFKLLEGSPLLHEGSILFVEYPRQLMSQIPDTLGSLSKVRDRKYGRTWVAVYAPDEDE